MHLHATCKLKEGIPWLPSAQWVNEWKKEYGTCVRHVTTSWFQQSYKTFAQQDMEICAK